MKKLISILLIITMMSVLAACKSNTNSIEELPQNAVADANQPDKDEPDNNTDDDKNNAELSADPVASEASKLDETPTDNQINYPTQPVENLTEAPTEKPAETKPAQNPVEDNKAETPSTLGGKLLAAFNANAASKSGEDLANAVLSIPEIQFSPVVMPIEEGLLTGFGNSEIKGFKSGVIFAPMIGSIPFVGYIFELESTSDIPSFISTLKASANLRWNVCSEADEMITGSNGNKVFFVMCPKNFDEE